MLFGEPLQSEIMATPSGVSEVNLKRIDNGYVLSWVQPARQNYLPGYAHDYSPETHHEFYSENLLEVFEKQEKLLKG